MFIEINTSQFFLDLLRYIIPSIIVFLVTYLTLRKFLEEDYKSKLLELKKESQKELIPIRLQAYERLTLLLERIKPDNLIVRLNQPNMSATQFKSILEHSVKEEFLHNVAQQIYVSNQAWKLITATKESLLRTINNCYKDMKESSTSVDFGKAILSEMMERNDRLSEQAIDFLKKEIELVM